MTLYDDRLTFYVYCNWYAFCFGNRSTSEAQITPLRLNDVTTPTRKFRISKQNAFCK